MPENNGPVDPPPSDWDLTETARDLFDEAPLIPNNPFGIPEPIAGVAPVSDIWTLTLDESLMWTGGPDPLGGFGQIGIRRDIGTVEEFQRGWRALGELSRNYDVNFGIYTFAFFHDDTGRRMSLPSVVTVSAGHLAFYGRRVGFDETTCLSCSAVLPPGTIRCACGDNQTCESCGTWTGEQLVVDDHGLQGWAMCSQCSMACELCGRRSEFARCHVHSTGERANCASCGSYTDESLGSAYSEYYDGIVCSGCLPSFCANCDLETRFLDDNDYCEDCRSTAANLNHGTEEFEPEEKAERDLFINAIPGRENIRRCGLEIEGGGSWRTMGQRLYDAGLTAHPTMLEYHSATNHHSGDSGLWSLERDGSVDWELVSPPINLADRDNVRALRGVLKIVREEVKNESVSLDMRCGLHIHVGAERTAIGGAFNLGTVWGYLEDVIFRLGAAKWPKHRAIVNGVHYCRPTQKGAKTRLEFGLQMDNSSEARYNALSFNNYIRSMSRNCQCGAVRYDSWDQCVCDLGKCTFEFRVFNTSANMHKIHAYLALCQSLVAWATSLPDLDTTLYPAQDFVPRLVEEMGDTVRVLHTEKWEDRLRFIFNELPLTDSEKADLLYCVRSSELSALGEEFINGLAPNNAQEVLI